MYYNMQFYHKIMQNYILSVQRPTMVSKITLKNDVLLSLIAMVISDPLPSDHAGLRLPLP